MAIAVAWIAERQRHINTAAKLDQVKARFEDSHRKEMEWLDMLHQAKNPPRPKPPFEP